MPVSYLEISSEQDSGQRIDNFLMRVCKGVPRTHIYRVLRTGEVRVNGSRVKASYRLRLNDRIRVPPMHTRAELGVQYAHSTAELLRQAVLFEDDDYLVLNKPAGLAVHGGSSVSAGIVEILREETGNPRLELVHRLDRGTSGCLMLGKRRASLTAAQLAFRTRQVKKIYELFVFGVWPKQTRSVQLKLQRYVTSWGERRVKVDINGRSARTDFEVLSTTPVASRLRAVLHTGRTHQIRVHASASGYPIIGDDKYANGASFWPAELAGFTPRLCLHAVKLQVSLDSRTLRFEAPPDEDLEAIWRVLAEQNAQLDSGST